MTESAKPKKNHNQKIEAIRKKTVLSSLSLTRYNFQDLSTRRRGGISKLKMEEEHRPNKDFDKTAEKRSETRNVF